MYNLKLNVGLSFCLLLVWIFVVEAADFNVVDHGAAAGGVKDSTQAFLDTWKLACGSAEPSNFIIPKGVFRVGTITFRGTCKKYMNVVFEGTLKADPNPAKFTGETWIAFEYVTGLHISGGGTFDGQGAVAWATNNCSRNPLCHDLPVNVRFNFVQDVFVDHVTSKNSKLFHFNLLECKNITFYSINIRAPGNSINTDGIHIGNSMGVNITNSVIATGDDCVSLGSGSVDVRVHGVRCGPGHGISVGSLGKYPNERNVERVTVTNCTIIGTLNGVRIKTWPKSQVYEASNFIFDDIIMYNVQNPVVIDQEYCPWNQCDKSEPSRVKISHASFNNIRGTSATKEVVRILCSKGVPCEDLKIGYINLRYTRRDGPATATCTNAKPIFSGVQVPKVIVN